MPKLSSICTLCFKSFEYFSSESSGKYCSNNCRTSHKKQIAGMDKPRICPNCNIEFFPKFNYQKTCSKECGISSSAKTREKGQTYVCKGCQSEFVSHRKTRSTFCSRQCRIDSKAKNWDDPRSCEICQNEYTPNSKGQRTCSLGCAAVSRGKEKTEKHSVLIQCDWCEKDFKKHLGDLGKHTNFCSVGCLHLYLRDGNPETIVVECRNCDEKFEVLYIDREQEFCSRSCASSGENNSMFGKPGTMTGKIPWTFGLTKETDKRIVEMGKKISITHKQQFGNGDRTHFGENNPNFGKTVADRTVEQLRNYSKGAIYRIQHYDFVNKCFKKGIYLSIKTNKSMNYRSSYEYRLMKCFDQDTNVISYLFESFLIPYGPNNTKNYLPDFLVVYDGGISKLVESKSEFTINKEFTQLKTEAGLQYCKQHNMEYKLMTLNDIKQYEKQLGIEFDKKELDIK